MRKLLTFLIVPLGLGSICQAETYTWVGGSQTNANWANTANWADREGNTPAKAPNIAGSGLYNNQLTFDGVNVSTSTTIELWKTTVYVTNGANVSLNSFSKVQNQTFNVAAGSVLNISNGSSKLTFNMEQEMRWIISGTLNINSGISMIYGMRLTTDLGLHGIVNFNTPFSDNSDKSRFHIKASLGDVHSGDGAYGLQTRTLVTGYTSDGILNNITNIDGGTRITNIDEWNALDKTDQANAGKYFLSYQDNTLSMDYIAKNIPEPSSCMLSMLGLGALLLRRKRS